MRCEKRIASIGAAVLLLAMGDAAYGVQVDRVVGVTGSGSSYLVKRFSVPAGSVVIGAELVTSDLRTVFPKIILLDGEGTLLGEYRRHAEMRNVRAVDRHVLRVEWPTLTVVEPQQVYVAVGLPPNDHVRAVGDGPGLGAMTEGTGDSFIASADDGQLQPLDVDLCIRLLFRRTAKAEITEAPAIGPAFVSIEAHPNPFNPTTAISLGVPKQAFVKLDIYAVSGRWVCSLANEELPAGSYSREWDGRDASGRLVSGGVYIAKLEVGETVVSRRLILLK